MTNPMFPSFDEIRTNLWLHALFQVSGFRCAEEVSDYIALVLKMDGHDPTAFKRYANGSQVPAIGEHPNACGVWVKFADQVWPGTGAWFCTPFWFILKNPNLTPSDLVNCARGLPPLFAEDLLERSSPNSSAALKLINVPRDFLYAFVDPVDPWTLGALACVMRRAELAADAGTMRWSAVGIMWSINYLLEDTDPVMRAPLEQLRQLLKVHFDGLICPSQFRAPIADSDIAQFDREQENYLKYFAECDFSSWEIGAPPPWSKLTG